MRVQIKKGNYLKYSPKETYFSAYFENKKRHQLIYNESGMEILKLLNGSKTIHEIILILSKKFKEKEEKVSSIVHPFVQSLLQSGLVSTKIDSSPLIFKGDKKIQYPDVATIELTKACPLRCKHCYLDAGAGKACPTEDVFRVIEELDYYGIQSIQLTGGEPFLHRDFSKIVDFILDRKISLVISTSGYVDKNQAKEVLQKDKQENVQFQISLDGTLQTHNEFRQKKDAFEKTISFVRYCLEKEISVVIGTCISTQSKVELEKLCAFVKQLGVREHRFGIVLNQGRAKENQISTSMTRKEFNSLIKYLQNQHNQDGRFKVGEIEDLTCNGVDNCGAGSRLIYVSSDLKVKPCPLQERIIGNLQSETLETIAMRNTKSFFCTLPPHEAQCEDCECIHECRNCFAQALEHKDSRECVWYEKFGKHAFC